MPTDVVLKQSLITHDKFFDFYNTFFIDAGFLQTLESHGIKMLRFPGLESPGKRHRSFKTLEKSWNSKAVVLKMLISGTVIAN